MTQLICYWKMVSISPSPEGRVMREQHPEIKFSRCKKYCDGYNRCDNYEPREINDNAETLTARVELFEDMVGRLETLEQAGGFE